MRTIRDDIEQTPTLRHHGEGAPGRALSTLLDTSTVTAEAGA
ncbi:hypothetical protein ACQP00_24505 [Dactylosporangium sp. CS-047395]